MSLPRVPLPPKSAKADRWSSPGIHQWVLAAEGVPDELVPLYWGHSDRHGRDAFISGFARARKWKTPEAAEAAWEAAPGLARALFDGHVRVVECVFDLEA